MAKAPGGIRQKLSRAAEMAKGVQRLHASGIVDLGNLGVTLQTVKNSRVYGPQATMAIQGGRKFPSLPAIVDEHGTLTYKQVDDMSNALARGLKSLGVDEGSVVGLLCRDHSGLVVAMASCGKLGARTVLMNTGFAKPQFAQVCEREGVKVVLHDSEFLSLLDALPAGLPRALTWVDESTHPPADMPTIDGIIATNSSEPLPPPTKPGGTVVLTSGTTGLPKGAPRSKLSPFATVQVIDRVPYPRKGTMVIVSPIFHSTGLATFLVGQALGNKVVTARRFDPEGTLKLIADHKADMLVAVPTMLHRMVELAPDVIAKYDVSTLKAIAIAGSALTPELSNRVQDTFGDVLYNMYGSTECGIATIATPDELRIGSRDRGPLTGDVRSGVVRRERPSCPWRQQAGSDLRSQCGAIRGLHRWPAQADHRRLHAIIDDYMSSGDVGYFDENGLLFVDGRDDDMIVSGGENVFPQEVENLLIERDDVFDAAVVGVDDHEFGKRLRAFIVSQPGAPQDAEEIKLHVKNNLARYKVPRDVVFIDELPHNATGKLLRRVLTEMDVDS